MTFTWKHNGPEYLSATLHARGAGGREVLREILQEVTAEAAADMRQYIATRGTGYKGHVGRIETGQMLNDVRQGPAVTAGTKISQSWGWTQHLEDYYLKQEQGFTQPSGHFVPPMHALLDSFVKAVANAQSQIKQAIKFRSGR